LVFFGGGVGDGWEIDAVGAAARGSCGAGSCARGGLLARGGGHHHLRDRGGAAQKRLGLCFDLVGGEVEVDGAALAEVKGGERDGEVLFFGGALEDDQVLNVSAGRKGSADDASEDGAAWNA